MIEITPKRQAMYVRKAIATLLSHKDIKRNSHSELKQACEEALKTLGKWFHEKTTKKHFTRKLWFSRKNVQFFPQQWWNLRILLQLRLCEINFGKLKSSKTASLVILEAMNFDFLRKFHIWNG